MALYIGYYVNVGLCQESFLLSQAPRAKSHYSHYAPHVIVWKHLQQTEGGAGILLSVSIWREPMGTALQNQVTQPNPVRGSFAAESVHLAQA